jgi:cytochrome bd ubiquinol oxidase subunit I
VQGLQDFPEDQWPDNIELLYYAFHIMVGLGTIMLGVMALAALLHARGALMRTRPLLWVLMLAFPFPYIANTAGWLSAELGRQPWVVYGLLRTRDAASPLVHPGSALFTLIGFCGLYVVLGLLYAFLMLREVAHGPGGHEARAAGEAGHV